MITTILGFLVWELDRDDRVKSSALDPSEDVGPGTSNLLSSIWRRGRENYQTNGFFIVGPTLY